MADNGYKLTDKEKAVFKYIRSTIRNYGYAPSVRDICAAVGIKSTSTVHGYIKRLEEKGYINRVDGKSRAMTVSGGKSDEETRTVRVPLLGQVRAGLPILAVENYEGYVDYPASMSGSSQLFALRVVGDSMIEAGILNGDIVIVESRRYAEDGEIVLALIDDSATVKYFFREEGRARLQPANSNMQPIYTDDLTILGKVIANFRFY
ncbi:MAG: transcriptional repressor LexA [Ruminococcaceae bacterium]|nr:transcriptional repressor LexA [Oscillospiraceae bacterium]